MPSALSLRTDYSPAELRLLAKKTKNNNQSRRLLSLAAVLDVTLLPTFVHSEVRSGGLICPGGRL